MKTVLVTGSSGFLGRNLVVALGRDPGVRVLPFDVEEDPASLPGFLAEADFVYHLAGVNRPKDAAEFEVGNAGLTKTLVDSLRALGRSTPVVLSSSTQAALDNPYGVSKRRAEELVFEYGRATGAPVHVFRLTNVFGKWSRPNYNSVVSTFCHNIAHGLEINVSDESREVELVYVDDVVERFLALLAGTPAPADARPLGVEPTYRTTLGQLARAVYELRDIRKTLRVPDLSDGLTRKLYATFLSYLDRRDFSYAVETRHDARGSLAELIKSEAGGQIFVSTTRPGIVRGNHYHDTKVEKFCVLRGQAVIRFRHVSEDTAFAYEVSGERLELVDIPPGYTHSIENVSEEEMIVLFWAGEPFDPRRPDTYACEV